MPDIQDIQREEHLAIENIFGKPPGWIVNWGITSGFLFLLVCLGIASFVKYPDKLMMKATLFSENPPVNVFAKITGEIDSILVENNSTVQKGQTVLKIKSTLRENDYNKLNYFIKRFEAIKYIPNYLRISVPKKLELGKMTSDYTLLMQNFEEFKHVLKQSAVFTKIEALTKEIEQMKKLNHSLAKQESLFESDVFLTEKDYQRNLSLNSDGVIAEVDKEKAESKLLGEKRSLEAFRTQQINNKIRIQQLITQINDLKSERANQISTHILTIHQIIDKIKGEFKEWEETHVIKSPIDGTISFDKYWNENQIIKSDESLFTVIPNSENQTFIARGNLPIRSSGNLKIGQPTIINIENYPSNQYGVLSGTVAEVSSLPTEDAYHVTIKLDKDLITTYDKEIPKKQNMRANISIQTQEFSLLERLFQNILDITKNRN